MDGMETLMKAHADFDSRDADGNTPFLLSSKHNGAACIDKILHTGTRSIILEKKRISQKSRPVSEIVDFWAVNNMGQSSLHLIVEHSSESWAKSYATDFMEASDYQRLDLNGHSPFHYALMRTGAEGQDWCRHMLNSHLTELIRYKV